MIVFFKKLRMFEIFTPVTSMTSKLIMLQGVLGNVMSRFTVN